jgi:hypothetical protein
MQLTQRQAQKNQPEKQENQPCLTKEITQPHAISKIYIEM